MAKVKEKQGINIIALYQQLSVSVRASLWFMACNIVNAGLVVLSTPVFTRLMSQDEYGSYNTFYSWRGILVIFTSLNLSYGVFNNAMVKHEDAKTRDEYISCMQGLYGLITLGWFLLYLVTRKWCNVLFDKPTYIVVFLFADMLCYPAFLFWTGRQRYEFKYKWLVIITLGGALLNLAAGMAAVCLAPVHKDYARIIATFSVDVLVYGSFLVYHWVKGRKFCIPIFWKYALKFNIPLIPHYLAEVVLNQADRIMISRIVNYAASAQYSIAYSIVSMLQLVMNAISASFIPWAYECLKRKKYDNIYRLAQKLMILICGLVIVLMLLTPEIILIFAGRKYEEAIYVILPLALSVFFLYLYDMFATVEFYFEKNIGVMIASVLSACLNVLLNAVFIPKYGFYAAGYTTLFCYLAYALAHYFFYKGIVKKELERANVFDVKGMAIAGIVMVAITLFINFIYQYILIRYALVLLMIIVIILKSRYIIEVIKSMKSQEV